jgi:hypothetical protein
LTLALMAFFFLGCSQIISSSSWDAKAYDTKWASDRTAKDLILYGY